MNSEKVENLKIHNLINKMLNCYKDTMLDISFTYKTHYRESDDGEAGHIPEWDLAV
jgi:hypothetical protein